MVLVSVGVQPGETSLVVSFNARYGSKADIALANLRNLRRSACELHALTLSRG